MRRFPVLVSLVAVVLLGMLALHAQPVAIAQEATPAGEGMMEPAGVTFEPIAIASGLTLPSPADMIAVRFRIEPGAVLPLDASDPTAGMLIVESGTLTVRIDADWAVSRGGSLTAAIATAEATGTFTPADEQIASGEEVALGAGDAAYIPGSVSGKIRNDGQETGSGLVVLVGPTEAMTGATPTS
jgi:quercetin dioxygenase-like cupin family protein